MAEYIDKDEAIRILQNYKNDLIYNNNLYDKGRRIGLYRSIVVIKAITKADVQPVNQWISCKDKMPDDGVNVLIYAGNHMIMLAWYDKDMEYFYICDSDYKYNPLDVTHWQPLPEPPKEVKNG